MVEAALRLVEKEDMDKNKALDAALSQIERAFDHDLSFLPKPFTLKQLAGRVKEVMSGDRG